MKTTLESLPSARRHERTRASAAVVARDLHVARRGHPVLHGLDLTIERGAIVGVLGPSGSGKTTLLRAVLGLQTGVRGTLVVLGQGPGQIRPRSRVAAVSQVLSVYDDLSVFQNLAYFAHMVRATEATIDRVLTAVDLDAVRRRRVSELSGGQRNRVSLAVALLGDPELLALVTVKRVMGQTVLNVRMLLVLLFMPSALLGLLSWVLSDAQIFSRIGSALFATYPVLLVTGSSAIMMLRERRSGTLERVLALPLQRGTLVAGYVLSFIVTSVVQLLVTVTFLITALGMSTTRPAWMLVAVGTLSGAVGASIGLVLGRIARTEFEAVQVVAAIIAPQSFLSGALVPHDALPAALGNIADRLPLTHSVQAAQSVVVPETHWSLVSEILALVVTIVGASLLAMVLLRRRSA